MLKQRINITTLLFVLCFSTIQAQQTLDNIFYCFNNGVRTLNNPPQSMDEQAALIKKIGYDGLAGHHSIENLKFRSALDEVGLKMPEIYFGMTLSDESKISYDKQLKKIIKNSKGRNLLVALTLGTESKMDRNQKCDDLFVAGITELAEFASKFEVKIAIYPHVNNYCEWLDHAVSISRKVNRENVGVIFNLCHLFKVEGAEGWESKILMALPDLFMVSINGTDSGDTQNMDWDQLIQPLGEGEFDTYNVVKLLKDNGYNGLFGLQCYNIDRDCETALTKSMKTWEKYKERYRKE
jgi:sugar phosphate isomerase/epimerase